MSEIIDNQVIESLGDFSQDILFDSQLFKKIKKADYSITEYSGFNRIIHQILFLIVRRRCYTGSFLFKLH